MTETTTAELDHFVPVGPTREPLDFADLEIIDFARFNDGPDARGKLAEQVHRAMTTQGFFVIINHGISEDKVFRMTDIGHTILKRTSPEEKEELKADMIGKGEYPGFKPRAHWKSSSGGADNIENFNINRNMDLHRQPSAMSPFRNEVRAFVDTVHKTILFNLLRLFAIALDIDDEEFFVRLHQYEKHDESWFRWMEYYDNLAAESDGKSVWLGGHQDLSALSLLFSQPMSTLQVRDPDDDAQWRYVRHIPGAIIVNAGEPMMWWTGGYFKAAVHRVIEPPQDQRGHDRSSVFYFVIPNDDVIINTLVKESAVLKKAQVKMWFEEGKAPSSKEWVNRRIRVTGQKILFANGEAKQSVQQKIGNVVTTWFI